MFIKSARRLLAGAAFAIVALGSPATAQAPAPAPVIFFDFFFGDNAGIPAQDYNQFFQWTVTGGSVDLVGGIGPGVLGAPPAQPAGRYVDLGGSTGDPGEFATRLPLDLLSGATYNLSFMYRSTLPGQLNSATASFGGQTFDVSTASETFSPFSRSFVVDSMLSSRIVFQGLESDTDDNGVGIDGVLLRLVALPGGALPTGPGLPLPPGAVPEPSTWATMILGLGAVGGAMRRRKRLRTIAAAR